jgi:tRNA-specific 2-thiouridylase
VEPSDPAKRFGSCCSADAAERARHVARHLGIAYYLLNAEEEFGRTVIAPFVTAYARGSTPVPCVACNQHLKFGSLLLRARAWDAAAVATGHYARVTREPGGRYLLWRGRDPHKDQSDFLWPLSQDQLAAVRFPLGDMTKDEVREHARRLGLATAETPESQEICFVPDDDYRGFLRRRRPDVFRPGAIRDATGAVLGQHPGVASFTIGQKKGLGLNTGRALYVVDLDPETDTVRVGPEAELSGHRLLATSVNFIGPETPSRPLRVAAKIRHSHRPAPATVAMVAADTAEVVFDVAQRAITPGQSVVWYDGDRVVGGGVIARDPAREEPAHTAR